MNAPIDSRGSAEDYPYDPEARVETLFGLEKLRAISDRKLAAYLFESYWICERNERDPKFRAEREREDRKKAEKDLEDLNSMADKASAGVYGKPAQKVAEEVLRGGRGRSNLEALRQALRKVPGRISG